MRALRLACHAGSALGVGAILYIAVRVISEPVTHPSIIIFWAIWFFIALLNLIPGSGALVAKALAKRPPGRRAVAFTLWVVPSVLILVMDGLAWVLFG